MAEEKKASSKDAKKTGWVIVQFTKDHGSKKVGDKETYHISTAAALIDKEKGAVAKIIEELVIYVPKEAKK